MELDVRFALVFLVGQVVVDLPVGDDDPVVHLALLQPGNEDFIANLLAESLVAVTVLLQDLPELVQVQLVFPGDVADGAVQGLIIDPDPRVLRHLDLQPGHDQPVQHLFLQDVQRRQRDVLLLHLRGHPPDLLRQFAAHDHVIVDDRDDPVQVLHRRRRAAQQGPGQRRQRNRMPHPSHRNGRLSP